MNKIKTINIMNIIVDCIIIFITFVISLVLNFNKNGFIFTSFMLSVVGVINLIFICIKEAKVMTYDSKRYTLILHVAHILFGVLLHYVSKHFNGFYNLEVLYWALLIIVIVVPVVIVYFMNKHDEKKKKSNTNAPKFIVNK